MAARFSYELRLLVRSPRGDDAFPADADPFAAFGDRIDAPALEDYPQSISVEKV